MDSDELPTGVTWWEGPPLEAWRAWTPAEAAAHLSDLPVPWCVIGGWAIDLAAGQPTREHEDLEIAVLRSDFPVVRDALGAFACHVVGDGEVRRLEPGALPPPDKHQNWVLDEGADAWRLDVMVEEGSAERWVYRRDDRISAPREAMVGTSVEGIPYLRPHGTLLFKAKDTRPKDDADFQVASLLLTGPERAWLDRALATTHPDHPWRVRLADA